MAQEPDMTRFVEAVKPLINPGQDFLKALQRLGLDPDALFWAWDDEERRMVLVLITGAFDLAGPLEISEALFKAYNAAATPKEVDPFIVRLHSPRQAIFKSISNITQPALNFDGVAQPVDPDSVFVYPYMGLKIPAMGIIKRVKKAGSTAEQSRRWARFSRNIEKLAA